MKKKTWIMATAIIGVTLLINTLPLVDAFAREIVKVEMWTSRLGTPPYSSALATSELLKAKHPWLRLSIIEGRAFTNVHDQDKLPAEKRRLTMINALTNNEYPRAQLGLKPWKRKFTDLKVVNMESNNGLTLATYNPNIKTPKDLIGKKIGSFVKVAAPTQLLLALLRDAWGILDKVKLSHYSPMAMKDALMTGQVDAVFALNCTELNGGKFGFAPFSSNITGARKTYWINVSSEDIAKVNKANPWKTARMLVPKDSLGPGSPPKDTGLVELLMGMMAWQDTPDEITYELAKFVDENAKEWSKRQRGSRMDRSSIIAWPGITEDMIHPGALKYYREKGIKIGK